MSKLIFPEHGGVLVDDHTRVVQEFEYRASGGKTYVVRIVEYPSGQKPFGYHYLDPEGGVTGSNSGNSYDADTATRRAVKNIRDSENAARLARRSPSQKKTDQQRKKIDFFLKHGGYSTKPGETKRQGQLRSARQLAEAEAFAEDAGWKVSWEPDQEPYDMGDAETEPPSEVYVAVLMDDDDNVLGSLGAIGDPDNNYKRVIEAELALEAMPR